MANFFFIFFFNPCLQQHHYIAVQPPTAPSLADSKLLHQHQGVSNPGNYGDV